MLRLVASTVVQHGAVGALTAALAAESYGLALAAGVVVNGAWWLNVGHRIDLHGSLLAGVVYAVTAALSVVAGALAARALA